MLQIHRPPKQKVGVAEQPQEVARSVVEQDQSQQEIILKQDITQQQSFEFVQTLLLVSFSSVCYLRDLLPAKFFEDRDYDALRQDALWKYDDFVKGKPPSSEVRREGSVEPGSRQSNQSRRSTQYKILARGQSAAANKLHLWLDAIFDALRKKYLQTAQLSIILEKNVPTNVVESYTFTFHYGEGNGQESSRIEGMSVAGSEGRQATIRNARQGLNVMVRHLVQLTSLLPLLPARRYLTTHLFFTENCPDNYSPPGFQENDDLNMLVPESSLWKWNEADLGGMDAGFHNVYAKAAFLTSALEIEEQSPGETSIASNLPFTKEMSRLQPSRKSDASVADAGLQTNDEFSRASEGPTKLSSLDEMHQEGLASRKRLTSAALLPDGERESERSDAFLLARLKDMNQTPVYGEDLTQTQLVPEAETSSVNEQSSWKLAAEKEAQLWEMRESVLTQQLEQGNGKPALVSCDCGFEEEEGDMIQCDCCDNWQHRHCYALEKTILSKTHDMVRIAKMRRICWMIRNWDITPSDAEFARLIGCGTREFLSMITQLKEEGIVISNPKFGSTKSKGANKPRYLIDGEKAEANFVGQGILHPIAMIQHLYDKEQTDLSDFGLNSDHSPMLPRGTGLKHFREKGLELGHLGSKNQSAARIDPSALGSPTNKTPILSRINKSSVLAKRTRTDQSESAMGESRVKSMKLQSPMSVSQMP